MFLINVWHTHRKAPPAPLDPWDARTLEWMTTNPPSEHNFDALPEVHSLDEFFHRKYEDVGEGDAPRPPPGRHGRGDPRRAGSPRRPPHPHAVAVVLADPRRPALPIIAFGIIYNVLLAIVGAGVARVRPVRLGAGAVGRRRRPTTTRRPTTGPRQRPIRGRSWPSVADATIADVIDDAPRARRRGRAPCPRIDHRPVQQQDGHVAVPRLGVPAVRRADLDVHALPRPHRRPRSRPDLRHPVHVGVELRAADVVADDGARRLGGRTGRTIATPRCGWSSRRCSAPRSSAARSTSSRRSTARASASRRACSRRASTR